MDEENKVYWLEQGTVLAGKYRIEDVIGEGGFGIVYLGYDIVLKMEIAIKEYYPRKCAIRERETTNLYIYKGESEDTFEQGLQKFYNEARLQAQFYEMDSIATVRDFFYENWTAYIINDYIAGDDVRTEISMNGKMKQEQVLQLMCPILRSLETIHQKGLLHRDISPDNIILQGDRAVLIDFGAARMSNIQDDRSMTVLFKRGYSAEEQYIRNGKQGPYTDVYAVCATMYYMLTGIEPEEAVSRRIKDHVISLKKFKDIEMDAHVREAIMKGMSVSVKNRYSSMQELYDALYGKRKFPGGKQVGLVAAALIVAVCLSIVAAKVYSAQRMGDHKNPANMTFKAVEASPTSGVSDRGSDSVEDDSPSIQNDETTEPPLIYQIPDVVGLKKEVAQKKIKKNSPDGLTIYVKKVYHTKAGKGLVVGQTPEGGRKYRDGEVKKIVLRISKGKKTPEEPVSTGTEEPTSPTAATNAPEPSGASNAGRKKTEDGFAGALPW